MDQPKDPTQPKPKLPCSLCTDPGHRAADCPYQASPTPLLTKLMGDLFGGQR